MPKVNCPGCNSLVTFDPKEQTEFSCPACGKQLRVKKPVKAVAAFAPKPIVVATIREPVEEEEEEEDDEPRPIRKKKKKRLRGPSGRVSGLLLPLGGLAALLYTGLMIAWMHGISAEAKVEVNAVSYAIAIAAVALSLGLGALVMQYSVNSLSRRNQVPEIEFAEAACLCPLVSMAGILGAMVLMLVPMIVVISSEGPGPADDSFVGTTFVLFLLCFISGGVGAMIATVKLLLGTRWSDAGSISLRFIVVSFLSNVAIGLVMSAIAAMLRTDLR